jgi:hypothetical protein
VARTILAGEAPAKNVATAPPLRDHYRALAEGFAEVRARFSGPLAVTDAWCNTDKNPDCDRVRITVRTPLVTDVALDFTVDIDGDTFVALAASALLRALRDVSPTRPLAISMSDDDASSLSASLRRYQAPLRSIRARTCSSRLARSPVPHRACSTFQPQTSLGCARAAATRTSRSIAHSAPTTRRLPTSPRRTRDGGTARWTVS